MRYDRRRVVGCKQLGWQWPCIGALVLATACSGGEDSRHVTFGFSSIGSGSVTEGTNDATTASSSTTGGGSSSESGDGPDSSGDTGPTSIVRGTVIDFGTLNMPPISGATVGLWSDPSTSTTSADDGSFELAVPAGVVAFVEVTRTDYWGALVRADASAGDVDLGEINIANDTFIEVRIAAFDNFDLSTAALIGRSTATDTTLSLTANGAPATAADEYFSIDAQTNFTLGDNVTRSAGFPAVVFFNLDVLAPGALTMSAAHPQLLCTVAAPTPPTKTKTITWVEIACA
jgi:hypothetical protein